MKGDLSLKKAIEEYKDIYLAYRNYAQRTRKEYVNDLKGLAEFLERKAVMVVGKVRLPHLVHYMAELDRRGYAGSTRKRKVISIKSFFGFLYMEGYTQTNVSKQLIPPYIEARKPRYLTKDEYNRLLECAKANKRDYAIIQLFLQTGIKLSELTRLTLNDLGTTNAEDETGIKVRYIRVVDKRRKKGRIIPLNSIAGSAIRTYLSIRKKSLSDSLFLNKTGVVLGKRGMEKLIGKHLNAAGIMNASVQSLRHTFGTYQASMGTRLKTLKEMMGHKDRRTAMIYYSLVNKIYMAENERNGS